METTSYEIKSQIDVKASIEIAADGTFSGYASTFGGDADRHGDRVVAGAFRNDLRKRGGRRPLLDSHKMDAPLGFVDLLEDSRGLRIVRGQLVLDVARAMEMRALVKAGSIDGLSIGYSTLRERRAKDGARELLEIELYEVSIVTVPANPKATIDSIKSSPIAEFLEQVRSTNRDLKASAADRAALRQAQDLLIDMRRTLRRR